MPIYEYQGQHYDLPDGLSNDDALGKIKTHLGQTSAPKAPQQTISPDYQIPAADHNLPESSEGKVYAPPKPTDYWEEAKGLGSSLLTQGAGALSTGIGLAEAPFRAVAGNKTLDQAISEGTESAMKNLDVFPKPASGSADKYNEAIGEAINRVGVPLIGMPHLSTKGVIEQQRARNVEAIGREPPLPPVPEAPRAPQQPYSVPVTPEQVQQQGAFNRGLGEEQAPVVPDMSKQNELPFDTSPETVARNQAEASPQGDLFANLEAQDASVRDTYGQQQRKAADLQVLDDSRSDTQKAAWEAAFDKEDQRAGEQEANNRTAQQADTLSQALTGKPAFRAPKGQRGSAPFINDLADLVLRRTPEGYEAMKGDEKVGYLKSNLTPEQSKMLGENANIDIVKAQKGQGIGSALYKQWAADHEGRIAPSGKTTQDAWNVWKKNFPDKVDSFVTQEAQRLREGASKDVVLGNITDPSIRTRVAEAAQFRVPSGQRGSAPFINDIADVLSKLRGAKVTPESAKARSILGLENRIAPDPDVASGLPRAQVEADGKGFNSLESGSTLAAMTRKSTAVDMASKLIQNAGKRAELYVRQSVMPMEKAFQKLGTSSIQKLQKVVEWEAKADRAITPDEFTLSPKEQLALDQFRQMRSDALAIQNKTRVDMGLKEISAREFDAASRWQGDFRQPVRDASGKLVAYLAADTKYGLSKQIAAMKKKDPTLVIAPKQGHVVRSSSSKNDVQAAYTTMLDVLGRDDPAVQRMKELADEATANEAEGVAGQKKHFEYKVGIGGYVGDRPGMNAGKEARAFFQQQVHYGKNAYKWAAMQEAGAKVADIVNDPILKDKQPNNINYIKDYYREALGMGTAKWVRALEDAVRTTGVSPQVFKDAVGSAKSFFITQKLAGSLGFFITNMLQPFNAIPHLVDLKARGYGGNPLTAVPLGIMSGLAMAAGHTLTSLGHDFAADLAALPDGKFYTDAFKYAEDNGVTARSIYDEAPIDRNTGVGSAIMHVASKTMSIPETIVRATSYMTFVQMLRDSKKFTNQTEIFQKAEELTNASMVDYRTSERALGFGKLGTIGSALNTLQSFPMNYYNQFRYFTKEAMRGNPAPLLTALALQYAMSGANGVPGFQDLDKLFGWAKEHSSLAVWNKLKDFDPKTWMIDHLGAASVYGLVSTKSGINLSGRLSSPGLSDMAQSPGAPIVDMAKQAGNWADAITSPTNPTKWTQALYDSTPSGLQGLMETGPLKKQMSVTKEDGTTVYKKTSNLEDRQGQITRTPGEETIRALGLRSQREVMEKDLNGALLQKEKQIRDRSQAIINKTYDAMRNGDKEKVKELMAMYTQINGKAMDSAAIQKQIIDEYTTSLQRQTISGKNNMNAVIGIKKIKEMQDAAQP